MSFTVSLLLKTSASVVILRKRSRRAEGSSALSAASSARKQSSEARYPRPRGQRTKGWQWGLPPGHQQRGHQRGDRRRRDDAASKKDDFIGHGTPRYGSGGCAAARQVSAWMHSTIRAKIKTSMHPTTCIGSSLGVPLESTKMTYRAIKSKEPRKRPEKEHLHAPAASTQDANVHAVRAKQQHVRRAGLPSADRERPVL